MVHHKYMLFALFVENESEHVGLHSQDITFGRELFPYCVPAHQRLQQVEACKFKAV